MNQKHVPDLEHCQELDRLCKEKGIVMPETEFYWYAHRSMEDNTLIEWKIKESKCGSKESVPAPLVSEQGEWLKDYMEDKENDGEAVPDDMPKADRMGLLWEPNFMQKVLNYLLAEGIITTL